MIVQPILENSLLNFHHFRDAALADATEAVSETKQALKLLEEKKSAEAIKALAVVTGKLELILARDPKLALAPVDNNINTHDLLANADQIKSLVEEGKNLLNRGQIQEARRLIAGLASEINFNTVNIGKALRTNFHRDSYSARDRKGEAA